MVSRILFITILLNIVYSDDDLCNYVKSVRYVGYVHDKIVFYGNGAVIPTGQCLTADAVGYEGIQFFKTNGSVKINCNQLGTNTFTINKYWDSADCTGDRRAVATFYSDSTSFEFVCGGIDCMLDLNVTEYASNSTNCSGDTMEVRNMKIIPGYCYDNDMYECESTAQFTDEIYNDYEDGLCSNSTETNTITDGACYESKSYSINQCVVTSSSGDDDKNSGVGVVIVVVFMVIIICAVMVGLWMWRKRKMQQQNNSYREMLVN